MSELGGLFDLGIVLMFALGWWVLELQGKRLDRQRAAREAAERKQADG